ncbi:MAG: futalosine hydrolase [Desulfobulbales bacterium]|nr:futalosine hydrolase [Desulfobulbales bacterium]
MLLITVATENEIKPLEKFVTATGPLALLVTGMGPVITAARLSHYLSLHGAAIAGVLNMGVAGAYLDSGVVLLDICLAKEEFLGDFGICMQDEIQDFAPKLSPQDTSLVLSNDLQAWVTGILYDNNIAFKAENFVTVNCCSGTAERGAYLRDKFAAGCENMEGAAVAMVCENFNIPCVELRCVSNMVEDRNTANWQLNEAIEKICRVGRIVLQAYIKDRASG